MNSTYSLPQTGVRHTLRGDLGALVENVIAQWILPLPASNPAMIEMLRDRDVQPYRALLPWSGEFVGKHLTASAEIYLLNRDPRLAEHIRWLVEQLAAVQAPDGYIGPWGSPYALTGHAPNSHYSHVTLMESEERIPVWDTWDFYHMMLGLIHWHLASGDELALQICIRLADLLEERFYGDHPPLSSLGTTETNLAPAHSFALLHQVTGDPRYLQFAQAVVADFAAPNAGNYLDLALEGLEFYQMPIPRWESLHPVMALSALYESTGEPRYRQAFEAIWWSIARTDRHNTGGFSSGESACGNPYDPRPIETCCTVAWMALSVEMLKMTDDPLVADELEMSLLNAGLGAISPSGRWCTYNTPMEGARWSSLAQHEIAFQSRPGSPELNCCSVNAPRALGLLSQWGTRQDARGLTVNFYHPGLCIATTPEGQEVALDQTGEYPYGSELTLTLDLARPESFALRLRIPKWSRRTALRMNGGEIPTQSGSYVTIHREWRAGDKMEINFDFTPQCWVGEREQAGRLSLYWGPLLLAHDPMVDELPERPAFTLDLGRLVECRRLPAHRFAPLVVQVPTAGGSTVRLCDFRSAGYSGRQYATWFSADHMPGALPFDPAAPRRTVHADEKESIM